jgi:YidC/Oxa1 family membrane protein insertase
MDRKSLIILALAVAVLLGSNSIVDHFFPSKMVPVSTLTNSVSTNNIHQALASTSAPASNNPVLTAGSHTAPTPAFAGTEQLLTVTNDDLVFTFTSHGGGLKEVALQEYPAVIKRTGKTLTQTNLATLNAGAPLPVLDFVDDNPAEAAKRTFFGDDTFNLTRSGSTVTAEKTLPDGVRLVKEFDLGSNNLFTAHVRFENTSATAVKIPQRELVIGTATAIGPLDDPTALGTIWYNGVKAENVTQAWFANRTLGCIPGTPRTEYAEGANNVVWGAVHNQFFTLAAIPSNSAPEIKIHQVAIPAPVVEGVSNSTSAYLTNGLESSFAYPAADLAGHQKLESTYTFYAGPKEYKRLAQLALRMNNNVDLVMDFGKYTGFFSKMLLLSLNGLHALGIGYGWAIIAITLIIKGVFWPLTRASTRSQKRMQALQPQMNAIAEKYKDDPGKKNQKTMEFMKEHKVSPLGSCLPMMIQIPVFIGFYYMLRNAIELRGVHFLWAHDLSQPDTIAYLGGFPINPLPIIMGATQLWQSSLMPPSPGMDPGQQKIMRYMPLMFVAMFYKMSAGLTLYWTVSNLLSILQTKITRMSDDPALKPAVVVPRKKT